VMPEAYKSSNAQSKNVGSRFSFHNDMLRYRCTVFFTIRVPAPAVPVEITSA
jgi:hypothetical protein